MTRRFSWLSSVSLIAVLALPACGGSSDPVTTPPTTIAPPPVVTSPGKTVVGPISGFGSIIVNGVRYDTSNTTFTIDGNAGTQADLKVGQVVVIKSETDGSGNAVASSVDYEEILEGPVSSVDVSARSFTILGQTILIDNSTSFDDDISPSSIDGLQLGDILEISGQFNSSNEIVATRVEKSDDQSANNSNEVHGRVADLDTTAMTFSLGTLNVGYSSAALEDFDNRNIANGDLVEVEGSTFLNDGTLVATKVEYEGDDEDEREGDENDEAEIRGLITTFESAQRFTVAGVTVLTNNATTYEDGAAENLGLDVRVEVEGRYNAAGELIANEIEFEARSEIEVSSTIDAVDTTAQTLSVFGITFTVDAMTRYEDNDDRAVQTFSLDNLVIGNFVEVSAYEDATGVLVASKIEREDENDNDDDDNDGNGDETEIEAPVTSIGTGSFTLLGVTVQTNGNTRYEIGDDENATESEFFARLTVGDIVEAEGSSTAALTLLAEEVSIKGSDRDSD